LVVGIDQHAAVLLAADTQGDYLYRASRIQGHAHARLHRPPPLAWILFGSTNAVRWQWRVRSTAASDYGTVSTRHQQSFGALCAYIQTQADKAAGHASAAHTQHVLQHTLV